MPTLDIPLFRARTPRIPDKALAPEQATVARNCDLGRGLLAPLKSLAGVSASLRTGHVRSIHLYERAHWFSWNPVVSAIGSPIAQDPYARLYYTGDGVPKVTSNLIATGSDPKPAAAYTLGVQAPSASIGVAVTPSGANPDDFSDDEDRAYVMTYVTGYGEEGAPGPPSNTVTLTDPAGDIVNLTLPVPSTNTENLTHKRIYRTATSGASTEFYLVAELPLAQTAFLDNVATLGKQLDTEDFVGPPANMQGLVLMANGIAAGFAGNELLFSAAYLPYAYPTANRRSLGFKVVALAAIGTSLIVGTEGHPYVFSGVSPDAMSEQKTELAQACVSARSMVDMGEFALYASPDGLVLVSPGRAELVTEAVITADQWATYQPATIHAYRCENDYVAFYGDATGTGAGVGGFVFRPATRDFIDLGFYATAGYNDLLTDRLYLVQRASGANSLVAYDAGDLRLPYTWRSKVFDAPRTAFSCVHVQTAQPALVALRLWVDGQLVLTRAGLANEAFKLPDVAGRTWQIELAGTAEVERVRLAHSMAEL